MVVSYLSCAFSVIQIQLYHVGMACIDAHPEPQDVSAWLSVCPCVQWVFRLYPLLCVAQDYHRFHFPVTGTVTEIKEIDGEYYTVNPVAVRSHIDVYGDNRRALCVVQTECFGPVCVVVVGATMVGSIVFTCREGDRVAKGDEMGYFAFGGSTLVTLFTRGTIAFDDDLRQTSRVPVEMLGRMGTSCGRSLLNVGGA